MFLSAQRICVEKHDCVMPDNICCIHHLLFISVKNCRLSCLESCWVRRLSAFKKSLYDSRKYVLHPSPTVYHREESWTLFPKIVLSAQGICVEKNECMMPDNSCCIHHSLFISVKNGRLSCSECCWVRRLSAFKTIIVWYERISCAFITNCVSS